MPVSEAKLQRLADGYLPLNEQYIAISERINNLRHAGDFDGLLGVRAEARALQAAIAALLTEINTDENGRVYREYGAWDQVPREARNQRRALLGINIPNALERATTDCGGVPVGTGVRISVRNAWYEGVITKVTANYYYATYDSNQWGYHPSISTARVEKYYAYSRLRVLRAPAEQVGHAERQAERDQLERAFREAQNNYEREQRQFFDLIESQYNALQNAQVEAVQRLVRVHAGVLHEYVIEALDKVSASEDVPGREIDPPAKPEAVLAWEAFLEREQAAV